MSELLVIEPNDFSLTIEKVEEIKSKFIPLAEEYKTHIPEMEKILNEKEITLDLVNKAKVLKTKLQKIRTRTENTKDNEKKGVLQLGNCIQRCHNIIVDVVTEKEKELEKIVKHFENLEKERLDFLQKERETLLRPYEVENVELLKLSEMSDVLFNNFLSGSKTAYEIKKKAEEDARIAEEQRKTAEVERIKKETEDRVRKEVADESKRREDELKKLHDEEIERVKKEAEEKELREKHAQERLEEDTKYKEFLAKNEGLYDRILKEEGKTILYKKIDEFIM